MKLSNICGCILVTFGVLPVMAAETYRGTFVHYEGAEYESTFIPCSSEEIWNILNGPEQQLLVARAMDIDSREIFVTLVLEVKPVDPVME